MKHDSSKAQVDTSAHKPVQSKDWSPEMEDNDPVWNLLNQASTPEPDPFFARNVVRSARLLENTSETKGAWISRVASLFSARSSRRLALGAAACVCALVTYQMWPTSEATEALGTEMTATPSQPSPVVTAPSELSELSELVIAVTLDTAAEDPTIFTHDEVVAMIGF